MALFFCMERNCLFFYFVTSDVHVKRFPNRLGVQSDQALALLFRRRPSENSFFSVNQDQAKIKLGYRTTTAIATSSSSSLAAG